MPKNSDISKAVDETEDPLSERDFIAALNAELLAAMRAEFQSAVGSAKKDVLRPTVKETLESIFLYGYDAAEKEFQNC